MIAENSRIADKSPFYADKARKLDRLREKTKPQVEYLCFCSVLQANYLSTISTSSSFGSLRAEISNLDHWDISRPMTATTIQLQIPRLPPKDQALLMGEGWTSERVSSPTDSLNQGLCQTPPGHSQSARLPKKMTFRFVHLTTSITASTLSICNLQKHLYNRIRGTRNQLPELWIDLDLVQSLRRRRAHKLQWPGDLYEFFMLETAKAVMTNAS